MAERLKCLSFKADMANAFNHMSFINCYDATNKLLDGATSTSSILFFFFFLMKKWFEWTSLIRLRVASSSYRLEPLLGHLISCTLRACCECRHLQHTLLGSGGPAEERHLTIMTTTTVTAYKAIT